MDYKTFVTYTVYVSMIALERPDLREKVMTESLISIFKAYFMLFYLKYTKIIEAYLCFLKKTLGY